MQPVYGPSLPTPYQQFYDVTTGMPTQPLVDFDPTSAELRQLTYAHGTSPRNGLSPLHDDARYGFSYNSPFSAHSPTAAASYEPLLSHSMSSLQGAQPMDESYSRLTREDSFSAPPPLPTPDGCPCVYCVHQSNLDTDASTNRQRTVSPRVPSPVLKHSSPNAAQLVSAPAVPHSHTAASTSTAATAPAASAAKAEPLVERNPQPELDESPPPKDPRAAEDSTPAAKARLRTVDPSSSPQGSRRNGKKKAAERAPHTPSPQSQAAAPSPPRTEPRRQPSRGTSHVVDLLGHHDRIIVAKTPIELCEGDYVIFEGDRGIDMGRVHATSAVSARPDVARPSHLPMVLRSATTDEIKEWTSSLVNEAAATVPVCQEAADRLGIKIKITTASFQFDRQKLTFFYDSPQRVDFRRLLTPMYTKYRCRIWLKRNE